MNTEHRVKRLEDQFGVNQTAETLDEMVENFWRKKYGPATVMGLVSVAAAHLRALNKEALEKYIESLRSQFPEPFVDCFVDGLASILRVDMKDQGVRDRRPNESKADYFKYQIKECLLVVGWLADDR